MFESEIEMEKKSASWVPLLFILGLLAVIVGSAGYYFMQAKKGLSQEEATRLVTAVLKAQRPAVQFHTGVLTSSVADKPTDPHYRLLEKAGLLKLGKSTPKGTLVVLTDAGERMLAQIAGLEKGKEKDGTEFYRVPLAERKLVQVSNVTMNGPSFAKVQYTWKWEPNRLGEVFDASGEMVKSFKTWDRANLIEKHGADFFHGDSKSVTLTLARGDKGWQIPAE